MENVTRRGFMAALAAGALAPAGAFADDGAALSSKMKVESTSACPPSQPTGGVGVPPATKEGLESSI